MKAKNKCVTFRCSHLKASGRRFCNGCLYKKKVASNPTGMAYAAWRRNATRRGKQFEITLEQFIEFAVKTDYMNRKGTSATSYHIDRNDETKGYTIDNIQVLQNTDNVKKRLAFSLNEHNKMEFKTITHVEKNNEDTEDFPF